MDKTLEALKSAYLVIAATQRYVLLQSRAAHPHRTYAVAPLDEHRKMLDLQVRTDRETAERLFCSWCFPWCEG